MKDSIRIGNAGGYWGDDLSALKRQLTGGQLDYITLDFLAEITMSILQKQRQRNPELGYATDFLTQIKECLPLIVEKKVTVITNAGGINPLGLGQQIAAVVQTMKLPIKVGVIRGDDVMPQLDVLMSSGEKFTNMETGEPFDQVRPKVTSANIYFGAEPVVKALEAGCQIIVTGRVTDTGITLAPMMYEFGWAIDDWDKIASGIVAGHIIECGCQATGGNITDWKDVKNFHSIGYPIIEMKSSGDFFVTKHPNTGGLVSENTVKEQLVYEMGDPANYIAPDGIARFDSIHLKQAGKDRVRVFGITGKPAPTHLKISISFDDGWKASGELLLSGPNIKAKAKTMSEIFWKRLGHTYEATRTELIGSGSIWPKELSDYEPNESLLRFGVRDNDQKKVEEFGRLLPSLILSGPSGVAVTGAGRPKPTPVVAYWPALMHRNSAKAEIIIIDEQKNERNTTLNLARNDTVMPVSEKKSGNFARRLGIMPKGKLKTITLQELAYARSGDKGDTCNIGVLARSPEIYDWLYKNLTVSTVKRFFKGIVKGEVKRYELDNLLALNFLLEETLGGGGTRSLMIDPQGKTLSQALLQMPMQAPSSLLKK
ncbi:MAG: acyclic terpene utilization AtuA family protein [candidate division Zixibacteria bacterium]|nr:acyclic terpene utilization AtuA family protein [candidate division Zixibacteria bacterium]